MTASFQTWPDKSETPPTAIKAKYLVGADGANSTTRTLVRRSTARYIVD